MDTSNLKIYRQPNGKYALWDQEDENFELINQENIEAIRPYLIEQVERSFSHMLEDSENTDLFNIRVEEYKYKNGLHADEKEEAISLLEDMGVSVEVL